MLFENAWMKPRNRIQFETVSDEWYILAEWILRIASLMCKICAVVKGKRHRPCMGRNDGDPAKEEQ